MHLAMQCNAGQNKARVSLISTYLDLTVKMYAIKVGLVLIPAQKRKRNFKTFTFFFSRNNSMKWTEEHGLTLRGEVLLQEPFKHPKNRGEVWGQIALYPNSLASPIFKVVSERSVRDRLCPFAD